MSAREMIEASTRLSATLLLSFVHFGPAVAGDLVTSVTSQVSERASPSFAPPDLMTGPDFAILANMMRANIGNCGLPRTAVVHWHALPDGLIDRFVLYKSSGNACFDEIVTLNAAAVVNARLRITPAKREGIAESGWVPMSVAARD